MDLVTVAIAVVSLLICALPFWFMVRNRKKNEKKMIQELELKSGVGQLKLTKYELSTNFIIGLEDHNNKLYFLHKSKNGDKSQNIDLNNFENCEVIKVDQAENANAPTIIRSISLRFIPKIKQSEMIILPLYNSDESGALSGEFQLANEWCQYLKEKLNQSKTTKN